MAADAALLAASIRRTVGCPPQRIGIFMERGADAYTAILATLIAGATYVPINPHHPEARIRRTLEEAQLGAIVADAEAVTSVKDIDPTIPVLRYDCALACDGTAPCPGVATDIAERNSDTESVAYILFTSGSTGRPKGVPITHANAMSFMKTNGDHYRFDSNDRFSQTFDLTFDLSVFDMFMAWQAGGTLYPMRGPELMDPVAFVKQNELTVWFSVPSVAALLTRRGAIQPGSMPSLRWSLFCGEALTTGVVEPWVAAAPDATLENLYGPTELTIACSRYRWTADSIESCFQGVVPIGTAFASMTPIIVDPEGQAVLDGEVGELCFDGPQRFEGYWLNPEETERRTVEVDGRSYYRTGDRALFVDGELRFVGRLDSQVQVLGHRVELGEVEAALRSVDGVVDAVAFGLPFGEVATTHLGAAVTVRHTSSHTSRTLRKALRSELSAYMMPRRVETFESFPLNANGKIDRQAIASSIETGRVSAER